MVILRISDGSTVCDLIYHSAANRKYMLVRNGWAPALAALRDSELGGRGPYTDVVEEIEINVLGESQADVLSNFSTLARLIDQAARWYRGDAVSVVKLYYAPEGASQAGTAVMLGPAPGDETSGVNLPVTSNGDLQAFMIAGLRLRFLRRGLWIGADSSPATSSSAANPTIHTVTFSDNQLFSSPTKVTIGGMTNVTAAFAGIIAVADDSAKMTIIEGENLAPATNWASVVDANARGGNVLGYNNTTTANTFTGSSLANGGVTGQRIAFYATLKNVASATPATYQLRALIQRQGTSYRTPIIPIDPTNYATPKVVFLGAVVFPEQTASGAWNLSLEAANDVLGVLNALQIDYIFVIALDDEYSRVVAFSDFTLGSGVSQLILDDRFLTNTVSAVVDASNPVRYANYSGDPLIQSHGTTLVGVIVATQGANWRIRNTTPATSNTNLSAVRHNAYLVPL